MNINMKAPLVATSIGFGLITVAHAAQPLPAAAQAGSVQAAQQAPMAQMPMMGGERPMMNDPQMRGQMSTMMQGCRKMMQRMENMSGPASRAR